MYIIKHKKNIISSSWLRETFIEKLFEEIKITLIEKYLPIIQGEEKVHIFYFSRG